MERITPGRVVWVDKVVDTSGRTVGRHAALILTTAQERPVKAVVISTKITNRKPNTLVPIKQVLGRPGGHPQTGLSKKCAAMCDWIIELAPDQIKDSDWKGVIFGRDLQEIIECVMANQRRSAKPKRSPN